MNLIITPIAVGGIMAAIGYIRGAVEKSPIRLEQFLFAFVFALAMATVRYYFAG